MAGSPIWLNDIAAFIVAFLIAIVVTPLVRKYAVRYKLGDKPNGRTLSTRMIPHLGGVALVLGTAGGLLAYGAVSGDWNTLSSLVGRALPAVIVIVALGLVDDIKNLRAIQKLSFQVISASMLVASGYVLFAGLDVLDYNTVFVMALTGVFIVGMSSAINLVDGHDGLAAGVSLISACAFAVLAARYGTGAMMALSLTVAGACFGFLLFNFPPGRIFMGDNGSMFLGTVLAVMACSLSILRPTSHVFLGITLILGVPILDAMLAITRRLTLRSPVFRADSLHMHHVLQQNGFTPRQTLAVLYSLQIFFCAMGVLAGMQFDAPVIIGAVFGLVVFVSFLRMMVASRQMGGRTAVGLAPGGLPLKRTSVPAQRSSLGR